MAFLALAAPAGAQAPAESIAIVEPFGPGSPSEAAIRVLRPAIERELKVRLLIEHIGSANGDAALARVMAAPPNGRMLLAITDASRIFHEQQANTARRLDQLAPVAKLTEGISLALAMPAGSPIDGWDRFAAEARARPLTVAGFGPSGPTAVFLALIERQLGVRFGTQRYDLDVEVLGAMARENEPGVLPTSSALAQHALGRPAPVVLLTSGARRHPMLTNTPTLAEIAGNPRLAFTMSVGLFGPPGLAKETVAALDAALKAAGKDEAVRAQARRLSLPLAVDNAQALAAAMARTRRVAQELGRK
jgi:tripartite-type tricarboxylate transporter receptor subunit TctC